jgi:lysophospholipase L1-like esterase
MSSSVRTQRQSRYLLLVLVVLVVALLAVACGGATGGSVSTSQPSQTPVPAPSAVQTSATSASTSSAAVSSSGSSWTYVAFGDSWPYGAHCNGCRPFPVLYAEGLAAATGRHVDFVNLATNGGTAQGLLADFKSSKPIRDDLARADIVMIAIGGNDYGPAFDASAAGTCGGADKLDCFRTVAKTLRTSFDGMLTEIEQLRQGRPTAIRLIATSNEFLADPDLIAALGADFGKTSGVAVTKINREVACEVAAAHNAKCVDLGLALNGPDLLKPQDVNTQDAMQAVADAIVASGVDELR